MKMILMAAFLAPLLCQAGEPFTNAITLADGKVIQGRAVWREGCKISMTCSNGIRAYRIDEIDSASVMDLLLHFGTGTWWQGSNGADAVVVHTGGNSFDVAVFTDRTNAETRMVSFVSLKMPPNSAEKDVVVSAGAASGQAKVAAPRRADDAGTGRMGFSEKQCAARYGDPVFTTNDMQVFRVDDLLVGVSFVDGEARNFSFRKAQEGIFATALKAAEIEKLLALFAGGKNWVKIDLDKIAWNEKDGPKQSDAIRKSVREYQWKRSDGRLFAFYDRVNEKLVVMDENYLRRTDDDPTAALDRL
jgi:hypothetical protein